MPSKSGGRSSFLISGRSRTCPYIGFEIYCACSTRRNSPSARASLCEDFTRMLACPANYRPYAGRAVRSDAPAGHRSTVPYALSGQQLPFLFSGRSRTCPYNEFDFYCACSTSLYFRSARALSVCWHAALIAKRCGAP
jgi:hypothetical protein